VKRRGVTTADRRSTTEDRRARGRSAAERAFRQIRLLSAALLVLGGAGYRPSSGHDLARGAALPLAGGVAAVLLLLALLTARAAKAGPGTRSKLAMVSTVVDAAVVISVVALAGLPPRSFALVLLMLPLLEAALWFGLSGLAGLWTLCSTALGTLVVVFPDNAPDGALGILVVAMPTLLLATIPVAMLAEHLVAQVGQLGAARAAADDRARLLGDLSAITAEIFPLDMGAVLAQLVTGAEQLGATEAEVTDPEPGPDPADAAADPAEEPDAETADATPADSEVRTASGRDGDVTVRLTRRLAVPHGGAHLFTALVAGTEDEVGRRVEALDLLVAQARVGLANAALVQQLELLKHTYEQQATRDQLTGLLNRRGLIQQATQLVGHLAVLFCDLDGFKSVNDTLGHAAGDELLEKVARRLADDVRADSVLGRMGGDEFVVVVPDATEEDLAALGRRIEVSIGRPFLLEAGMARIGVSIGTAHAEPGDRDLDGLLGRADQVMYEVKRTRKSSRAAQAVPPHAGATR
jgi:diguanylate cyclase (GGDEF)-like protein